MRFRALKAAVKEDKDIFTSELRSEYSARYAEAKRQIERGIAEVYGERQLSAGLVPATADGKSLSPVHSRRNIFIAVAAEAALLIAAVKGLSP